VQHNAKTTEQDGDWLPLEAYPLPDLLAAMQAEDRRVPEAVAAASVQIAALAEAIYESLRAGGRLFYLGSGTSGRLGILDASECPPTFGVPPTLVTGIIAGGDGAIRQAVEGAEDDRQQGWADLQAAGIQPGHLLVGLSASGTTPYVLGAVEAARAAGVRTGCITCNPQSPLAAAVDHPVEVIVGPEFVTGSTRLKAGTAQKLVLNQLTTTTMIRLGYVAGRRMVDMQLTNAKLVDRGTRWVQEATQLPEAEARALLLRYGSVRKALEAFAGQ
jgi:N-acetylmuramic acid 6-phosphate etherase